MTALSRTTSRFLGVIALAATLAALGGEKTALANPEKAFKCTTRSCANNNGCLGDLYDRNGCVIVCYEIVGDGEINWSGQAECVNIAE